jgi:DNA-binding transcriptional ArsR family regulator
VTQIDKTAVSDAALCDLEAELCRALGDATRLRILYALARGPLSVGDVCRRLALPQPTASRHLKVLRDQSLVSATREGQFVRYRLRGTEVLETLDMLRRVLAGTLSLKQVAFDHETREGG